MPRKPIRSLCEEAAKQAAGVSKTSFFSEKFKRSREISSLGRFVELYTKQKRVPELNFVDGDDDAYRRPDFTLFLPGIGRTESLRYRGC